MKLVKKYIHGFVSEESLRTMKTQTEAAAGLLHSRTGPGNEFLGWLDLPVSYDKDELERIKNAAERIKKNSDVLIVIGIGGSYLGARAAIEFLKSPLYNNLKKDTPDIYYAGNGISPEYLNELLEICEGRNISVNVISKSGTTTEPALAFRVFKKLLEKKYGADGARSRIYCTTDKVKGTLKELADEKGYETFAIADDIGGRYSVLTAVGLLPIAVSGCDVSEIMRGAAVAMEELKAPFEQNDCYQYAALRNILYRCGKHTEIMVSYDPAFVLMAEWYKQLFGESEGKENKGIFPAAVNFSADLHSMGQYIQEGLRIIFETVIDIKKPKTDFFLEDDPENLDSLNFLTGQNMSEVNRKAFEGTVLAHSQGGVPNIVLELEDRSEYSFGYMVYFFEKACAVSGYILGVNPFNQPGVEAYKNNMFALLNKPGYEKQREELLKRL
ncbi:MAG: glucose-6-phosphate isomerase [Oscillospiraceae bacterium]|nr:glucose-6-phosphate isomerase [Oscillospiraceae bacterium]